MSADVEHGKDPWIGLGLAEAADGARIGPAPVADILAGGRRLRHRRRTVVGAVALASVVALTGGALAQLRPDPAAARAASVAPAPAAAGAGAGAAAAQPEPAVTVGAIVPGVRDPFSPIRVRLGKGVVNGKTWELWQALWPVAPKERAYEQALAVWQERAPYDPVVTKPTEDFVLHYYDPDSDVINTYVMVDGVRLGHDSEGVTPSPGKLDPRMANTFGGGLVGHRGKDDVPVIPLDLVHLSIGPDVGRVLVTWEDGTTTEPTPVTVGDSPTRHMVIPRPGTMRAKSWQFFDKNGTKLPDAGAKYLTEPSS
ncbi:hypothetical protein GCM10018790_11120 [Kitasatospora xanthocidica]|uniref:hypothetical protein n=1 Tax=Kitasatospora xanthocidica TaxID=83382 RepID=UPI0016734FB3|nr:hypothetical protein [Kitasatospora xanthocidica]GHF35168.1 hypothetical protein GCM10018790_11120 [Kitasatospora xanthocidica]